MRGLLHRSVDRLATWTEDRIARPPAPFVPAAPGPLDCFGPLPPPPPAPDRAGPWRAPSPRPATPGDAMALLCFPARAPFRATAVLCPPWKIGSPRLVRGWIRLLGRAGLDAWLVVPPHHLHRTPAGARSGEAFFSPDLARTRAALEQYVIEVRSAAAIAAARGPAGLVGLSLGGLAAALAATGPEPLRFVASIAPPADLAALLERTAIGRRFRRLAERAGVPMPRGAALRDAVAPLDPERRPRPAAAAWVAGGRHDAIALASGARRLAAAWGVEPRLYPRGHMTLLFACRAVRRDLARFLDGAAPPPPPG